MFVLPILGGLGALIATMAAAHSSRKVVTHNMPLGMPGYTPLPGYIERMRVLYMRNPNDARIPELLRRQFAEGALQLPPPAPEHPGAYEPPYQPPYSQPTTPSVPAPVTPTPEMASRVSAWLKDNVPPLQDQAMTAAYRTLASQLGRTPNTAELCGIMQSQLSSAQMASLVSQVPEFAACVTPGTQPSVTAPPAPTPNSTPASMPSMQPGMPAPPPVSTTTTPSAQPATPVVDVTQPGPIAPSPLPAPSPEQGLGDFTAPYQSVVTPAQPTMPPAPVPTGGVNLALAAQLAPQVAANINSKHASYDRNLLKRFQTAAGLTPDGLYGGYSAGAIRYFTKKAPPKPLVNPAIEKAYVPPSTDAQPVTPQPITPSAQPVSPHVTPSPVPVVQQGPIDLALAQKLAPQVEADIKKNGARYNRTLLKQFQSAAGLTADGFYGGYSAGALRYFLQRTPPKPLVNPAIEKPYQAMSVQPAPSPASPVTPASHVVTPSPVTPSPAPVSQGKIDLALAEKLAPEVEKNILAKRANYDRNLLKQFQSAAGLTADGLYGGYSAGALRYFLHRAPPKPLVNPAIEKPYQPMSVQPAPSPVSPVTPASHVTTAPPDLPPIGGNTQQPAWTMQAVDLAKATQLAPIVAADIVARGKGYDHGQLAVFQMAAGLRDVMRAHPDFDSDPALSFGTVGNYGGYTAGALQYFLAATGTRVAAPPPLYPPLQVQPYTPPGGAVPAPQPKPEVLPATGVDTVTATALAPKVAADITAHKFNYSRPQLQHFQQAAGIPSDGMYGGEAAGALRYYLHAAPPKPLFSPTIEKPYSPPTAQPGAIPQPMPVPVATPEQEKLTAPQAALKLRDYLASTGDFGSKAHPSSQVARYQGPLGTAADGIVGPKTRTAAAKYGVILPVAAAASSAPATTADLMQQPPSRSLALRSVLPPAPTGAVSGIDLDVKPLSIDQLKPVADQIIAWSKGITPAEEAAMFKDLQALASERGVELKLPLTYDAVEKLANHPALACGVLQKRLPKEKIAALLKLPTMSARWALFCANKLEMPVGFPQAIWNDATDEQRKSIVINWLPGVIIAPAARPVVPAAPPAPPPPGNNPATWSPTAPAQPTATPAAQPVVAPVPQPGASTLPPGYDPNLAKTLAREVVRNISARSYDYDRNLLKKFQTSAAIKADGIYGAGTKAALQFYNSTDRAPNALFGDKTPQTYKPPM
jgi:murein L,D-transpeptidase YcbB/YkuD